MDDPIRGIVVLASLTGCVVAVVFLRMLSGRMSPQSAALPAFCRLDRRDCGRVLDHPDARLFGVPNVFPGLAFFAVVFVVALLNPGGWAALAVVGLSWMASAVSIFLLISLAVRVRVRCTLCLVSHFLTILISALLTLRTL